MSSTFEILAPASSSLTVEQASKGTLTFQVRNTASSFHNLGVRVAVLNAAGDEDPAAAAAGWFSVAGPTDSFVPAGSTVDCVVTVSPPLTAEVGSVTFVLVAFDSDLADEDFTRSQPATLAVTKKPEEEEEKPPIPFWVWIAVGLGALALVVAIVVIAVNAGGDDDDATAATDDDDATTAAEDDDDASTGEVVPLRRLPILFKAYEGNDPLTGALAGVVFKMESSIDSTKTVTTNGDGDGAQELCIVQDPSASTDGRCLKVQAEFSIFASKAGYKNSPVTTLVVADLVEAPKTYVKMVPNASSANPTRPVVVPEKYTLDLEDYMSRYGRELEISGGVIDWKGLRAGAAVTATPQVWLVSYGDQKLQVIKIVREYTGLGLKESKELVDGVDRGPVAIPGLTAEQSKRMAEALSEVGAQVKVK